MLSRISQLIESTGLNQTAFAARIGVLQKTLWLQLNGQRKLSLETVNAILEAFPDISAEWLMRGTGGMKKGDDEHERRISQLIDVISMQQEKIKELQNI